MEQEHDAYFSSCAFGSTGRARVVLSAEKTGEPTVRLARDISAVEELERDLQVRQRAAKRKEALSATSMVGLTEGASRDDALSRVAVATLFCALERKILAAGRTN